MKYRALLLGLLSFFPAALFAQMPLTPEPTIEGNMAWYDTSRWELEGKGWKNTSEHFTRMPKHAEGTVPTEVWGMAQESAGLAVRFKTDAPMISVRHEVSGNLTMNHMTTVGSSGLDLYAKDDNGIWRWAGVSRPDAQKYEYVVLRDAPAQLREYKIYLPLYNITKVLSIGVPRNRQFEAVPPSTEKPVLWYGTSILQGCSASRPGMAVPAIIGRRLQVPVINFGINGFGHMEIEMAKLIAEVDASVFVLDCMPNLNLALINRNTEPFIRELRRARPDTPIIMVEMAHYSNAWIQPRWEENRQNLCKSYREIFERLQAEGMTGLTYVYGNELYGSDSEGTVDGGHPSDLGKFRSATVMEPVLREVLKK